MRKCFWVLAVAGITACGDNDGSGGRWGADPANSTTTLTTSVTTGTVTAAQGGAGGEGGQAPKAPNGAACTDTDACEGGICLREDLTGHPGGLCTSPCSPDELASCDGHCVEHVLFGNICLLDCLGDLSVCRDAYECRGSPDGGYTCVPACMDAADCPTTGTCIYGYCQLFEETDCEDEVDDDLDGDVDCYDSDCQSTSACPSMAEVCGNGADDNWDGEPDCEAAECAAECDVLQTQLCAAAPPLAPTQTGNTGPGPGIGAAGCVPYESAGTVSPQVYSYQAPAAGTLTLTLTSVLPHTVRVIEECEMTSPSSVKCVSDSNADGYVELDVSVVAGADYTILVFAAAPAHVGAFTLTSELQ